MKGKAIVCLVLCLVLLGGCSFFQSYFEITEISDSMREALLTYYGFPLPDSAVLLEGHMAFSFQDPCLDLTFRLPREDLEAAMDGEWVEQPAATTITEEVVSETCYFRKELKTCQIFISSPDRKGEVLIRFLGDSPRKSWL